MAYVAADKDKKEWIFNMNPFRDKSFKNEAIWNVDPHEDAVELPKGSIEKLTGKKLTWEDEPVELKGEDSE